VVGWLAVSLGLLDRPRPIHLRELVPRFAWHWLRREDWVMREGVVAAG
jgi:hypothetical protein